MNRKRIIAMWLLYRRIQNYRKQRKRIYWVHPINQRRDEAGTFICLMEELRADENKFINYFRMSISSFDELHNRLKDSIQRQNTNMRNCIQPMEMLAVTLRYLASGCSFTDLHYTFSIGISTASVIVKEVCRAIWTIMKSEFLPNPSKEHWKTISSGFERNANFPHCIGAIDGKHIRIICSRASGNYGGIVVLMAIADSNYRFVYVNIGSYGKDCNSAIYKQSGLWKSIATETHQLPEQKCLPGTDSPKVPYFFVGDDAFALHKHLLRPFAGSNLTAEKKIFNYRLSRARRYVECTFAILSNKWQIFHRPINVKPEFAIDIVKACVILHNFVREKDGVIFDDTTTITGFNDLLPEHTSRGGLSANNTRQNLCNYFASIGAVPWQLPKV